jgi:hypothetical protein
MYDFTTKIYWKQAEVVQNRLNANAHATGCAETTHRKHKRLKLGDGQAYDRSSSKNVKTYSAAGAGIDKCAVYITYYSLYEVRKRVRCP